MSRGLGVRPSSPLGGSVTLAIHAVSSNFSFIFVFIKLQIPSHYKILWFYNYESMKWRDPRLRKQLTEHSYYSFIPQQVWGFFGGKGSIIPSVCYMWLSISAHWIKEWMFSKYLSDWKKRLGFGIWYRKYSRK